MTAFKCKMCGGSLEFAEGSTVAKCKYCGTQQTLPRLTNDRRANLYDRANHFRRNNEFDKAMAIYETILNEDNTDAEAYWSLVLCRYGIEYVEDPASHRHIPTVNRTQFTSIYDDDNYRSALKHADEAQRQVYEAEAKTINDIQKGILAISQKEEPFDVFICYKETDRDGRRTHDSVLAQELYYGLKEEGFKVFFSRITLEDKLGSAYEPYIFAALNSAKVMVVLGTHPDHFNAVWVKNEWSRYLALIGRGQKKTLIPAYRDMDPYDLPEEFSHLQAQDMAKLGFMQDLIRGIKKIIKASTPKPAAVIKETVTVQNAVNVAPLLQRAFLFLEDGDWNDADEQLEKVLDADPENAQAYVGKLMAELHIKKQSMLEACEKPFDENHHYLKAVRFADPALKTALEGYTERIRTRAKQAQQESIHARKKRTKKLALILTPLLCLLIAGAVVLNYVLIPRLSTDPNDDTPPTVTPEATDTEAAEATTTGPETTTKAPETTTKAPETTTRAPETTTKAPETTTKAPETTTKAPETTTAHIHVLGEWVTSEPATCTKDGERHRSCTLCGETVETEVLIAPGHAVGDWIVDRAATCDMDGVRHKICATCGETTVSEKIYAPGHTLSDWIVDRAATCALAGVRHRICTKCDVTLETETLTVAHTEVIDAAVPATCIATGLTAGSHCEVCKAVIVAQTVADMIAHTYGQDGLCTMCQVHDERYLSFTEQLDGTYSIAAKEGVEMPAHLVIPVTCQGKAVTKIEASAFANCSTLQSITIPSSVTVIGESAFSYCKNLKSIELPDGLTAIQQKTFYECNKLKDVIIPESVTEIGAAAFAGCASLTEITLPHGVTELSGSLFGSCGFTHFEVPDHIKTIGTYVFTNCTKLTSVIIPESVTKIGKEAFNDTPLETVYYAGDERNWPRILIGSPNDVLTAAEVVYASGLSCLNFTLQSDGTYEVSAKDVSKLPAVVVIPAEYEGRPITAIANSTFQNCTTLQTLVIPESVTRIGENAFRYCSALTSLTLPEALSWHSWHCFDGMPDAAFTVDEQGGMYLGSATNPYFMLVKTKNPTSLTSFVTHSDTKIINAFAFENCTALTKVVISEGVRTIADGAFSRCTNLTTVSIPSTVTFLEGVNLFAYCPNITEVTVAAENKTYMSTNNCIIEKATKMLIAGCVSSVIPADGSVTSIKGCAFQHVPLKELVIPEGIDSIYSSAFRYCDQLTSVVLPSTLKSIAHSAFSGCNALTSITVAEGNPYFTSDGSRVMHMSDMTLMVSATNIVPEGVKRLGDGLFYASDIQTLYLPASLTEIDELALDCCEKLTDIYYAGTEAQWAEIEIFDNNNAFDHVTIHFSSTGP